MSKGLQVLGSGGLGVWGSGGLENGISEDGGRRSVLLWWGRI